MNESSSGIRAKRRRFQSNKENKVPEEQDEAENSDESPERHVSNMDHSEGEPTQDYSVEENENVLQERQKNGSKNNSGAENEGGSVFLFTVPAFEDCVMFTEYTYLTKNSKVTDCQVPESLEEGDSNG